MRIWQTGLLIIFGAILPGNLVAESSDPARLLEERFDHSDLGSDWWVEGGESVKVIDGRLHVAADPPEHRGPGYVATIWHRTPIAGDVRITFKAQVLRSSRQANNINFFLFYTHPDRTPLEVSRNERADGHYAHYHELNGYIFTFINAGMVDPADQRARMRLRRNPGFELLDEAFDYHCQVGRTYTFEITRRAGRLTFAVDGNTFLEAHDAAPWQSGHIGLRTFHTDLWWDDLLVEPLGAGIESD